MVINCKLNPFMEEYELRIKVNNAFCSYITIIKINVFNIKLKHGFLSYFSTHFYSFTQRKIVYEHCLFMIGNFTWL